MDSEQNIDTKESDWKPLTTVTPLSKYLAMILFVILPFAGGWLGYSVAIFHGDKDYLTEPSDLEPDQLRQSFLYSDDSFKVKDDDRTALASRDMVSVYYSTSLNFSPLWTVGEYWIKYASHHGSLYCTTRTEFFSGSNPVEFKNIGDSQSFDVLAAMYGVGVGAGDHAWVQVRSDSGVYLGCDEILGADPGTYEVLQIPITVHGKECERDWKCENSTLYSKDKNHVYFSGRVIASVDFENFSLNENITQAILTQKEKSCRDIADDINEDCYFTSDYLYALLYRSDLTKDDVVDLYDMYQEIMPYDATDGETYYFLGLPLEEIGGKFVGDRSE